MVIAVDVETILSLTTLLWLSKLIHGQFPPPIPHHPRVKIHSDSIGFPAEPVDTNITLPVERSATDTGQHVTPPLTRNGLWNDVENLHGHHLGSSLSSPWAAIDQHLPDNHHLVSHSPHQGHMHRRMMLRRLFLQNPILFQREFPFLYRRFMRMFSPHNVLGISPSDVPFDSLMLDRIQADPHKIQPNSVPHPMPPPEPEPYSKAKSTDFKTGIDKEIKPKIKPNVAQAPDQVPEGKGALDISMKKNSRYSKLTDTNFAHFHYPVRPSLWVG